MLQHTDLVLGPSNSQKNIPCQVPNSSRPPITGIVMFEPVSVALMWAEELPSPWAYPSSYGTIFSSSIRISRITDGSAASFIVIPAVVWGTKILQIPILISDSLTFWAIFDVIFINSFCRFVRTCILLSTSKIRHLQMHTNTIACLIISISVITIVVFQCYPFSWCDDLVRLKNSNRPLKHQVIFQIEHRRIVVCSIDFVFY